MSDLTQRLSALPAERRAQFLALLRAQIESAAAHGPTQRGNTGSVPLSYAQEALWSADHSNIALCLRLRGDLDVTAFRSALAVVVARHEALRTAVMARPDGAMQEVVAAVSVEIPVVEVAGLAAARALAAERVAARFDLSRPPLWRVALIKMAPDDRLFLFVAHQIIVDRRSLGLLTGELAEVYRSLCDGREPRLPALPVQYPDYALWHRERLGNDELDRLIAYWRNALAGVEVLEFPTDRPRGETLNNARAVNGFALRSEGAERARKLAGDEGTTSFDVLVAAFFALLHRYSGHTDLVLGSPVANRRHDGVSSVIGCFTDLLAVRGNLSDDPTFRELVGRIRQVISDAREHDDLPFSKLIDAMNLPADTSRAPICQIAFAVRDAAIAASLPGLVTSEYILGGDTALFDMSWTLVEPANSTADTRVEVEFNTDLFDGESIARFARHYDELLCNLTADPDAPLSAADVLSVAEREALTEVGSGSMRPIRETTVVAEFETRVAEAPDSVAVVVEDVEFSYADLNARANRLAALLRERGAEPGGRIGLCLRRNVDLTTAMLAVLKTGAAYVPLDPAHPPARVAEIAADAGVLTVLAHTAANEAVKAVTAPVVTLDDVRAELVALPAENPPPAAKPDDVAYVIYTSGSSGKPKGVLLEHRGVVSFIDSTKDLFDLTPADRVLGFASITFDVSVFETFSALLTGARLYVTTEDERLSVDRLQALMERTGITVIDLPPAVMPLLVPEKLPALRIAFVGGEAFSGELVNRWNQDRRVFNGYGPTECTVTMIVEECMGTWVASPPIGLPMTNHVAHVLDHCLRHVPIGVPGELVIGGAGLARSYLDRPELTAEKFVTDPFGTAPGGRLYRTGDLVKRLADGRLVFIGRLDQQVKIRGLRIELGEVESALAGFPGIGPVSVRTWTDDNGEKHLVGYLTRIDEQQVPSVREHLSALLPSYMIPLLFVVLAELPITSSGKVDWRRLPAPDPGSARTGPPDGPRTGTELALLSDVIAPLLRNDRLGVHDDFFQAGGNSLQAAQLLSAINRRFGVEIPLGDFFISPTAAHLATTIDTVRAARLDADDPLDLLESLSGGGQAEVLMRPPSPPRVILLHPSGGELFCYISLVRALSEGIGVAGFPAVPADADVAPEDLVTTVAARIAAALTELPESFCLAGWSYGGVLAFEVARLLARDTGVRPSIVLLDAWDNGDLVPLNEPMVRQRFVHDVARLAGQDGPRVRAVLDDPGLVDIRKTLASLDVDLRLSDDELAGRYAIFRAAALALQTYQPSGSYDGPVTLLAVSGGSVIERWRAVCTGRFESDVLPGDHYTLFSEPALGRIVAEIERALTH